MFRLVNIPDYQTVPYFFTDSFCYRFYIRSARLFGKYYIWTSPSAVSGLLESSFFLEPCQFLPGMPNGRRLWISSCIAKEVYGIGYKGQEIPQRSMH